MGLEQLDAFLRRHRCVAIDASPFIYQLQDNPRYLPATNKIFTWLERAGSSGVTSCLTLTELLVQPMKEGDEDRVEEFFGLLTRYPHLEWVPVSVPIAARAARLRVMHRLRTPDAILAATAVYSKATGLISNDTLFRRLDEIQVMLLDDVV